MKLSHGLKMMLEPLTNVFGLPDSLSHAMRKAGKRGHNATLYPTDLRKVNVILETIHDVSGKVFSVEVIEGNIESAMLHLKQWIKEEDYMLENIYAAY